MKIAIPTAELLLSGNKQGLQETTLNARKLEDPDKTISLFSFIKQKDRTIRLHLPGL